MLTLLGHEHHEFDAVALSKPTISNFSTTPDTKMYFVYPILANSISFSPIYILVFNVFFAFYSTKNIFVHHVIELMLL